MAGRRWTQPSRRVRRPCRRAIPTRGRAEDPARAARRHAEEAPNPHLVHHRPSLPGQIVQPSGAAAVTPPRGLAALGAGRGRRARTSGDREAVGRGADVLDGQARRDQGKEAPAHPPHVLQRPHASHPTTKSAEEPFGPAGRRRGLARRAPPRRPGRARAGRARDPPHPAPPQRIPSARRQGAGQPRPRIGVRGRPSRRLPRVPRKPGRGAGRRRPARGRRQPHRLRPTRAPARARSPWRRRVRCRGEDEGALGPATGDRGSGCRREPGRLGLEDPERAEDRLVTVTQSARPGRADGASATRSWRRGLAGPGGRG